MNEKLFCYLVDFGSVSSGDDLNEDLVFASDSDFFIKAIRTNLSDTCEAKISIKNENGEEMSNNAFELRAIAGSKNPINVFDEVKVRAGAKWNIIGDVSAGTSQPLQLQFWGIKVK